MKNKYKRVIIKIGSNVLATAEGLPDVSRIRNICSQIVAIQKQGIEVVLVSSGAVASGRSLISLPMSVDTVSRRQVLAAVGQVRLIGLYADILAESKLLCAQILVTKEDFRDRLHYLNMKNCFAGLLDQGVIPIINENDVISVTELMFTDNDELAGLVATMLEADALIILSNVDGIYNGNPSDEGTSVIEHIKPAATEFTKYITTGRSEFGRGGMASKAGMARKMAALGTAVYIANGMRTDILPSVLSGKQPYTYFEPAPRASGKKRWIAQAGNYAKGNITINAGALEALFSSQARSLLPVGITNVSGDFKKGDIVSVISAARDVVGLGIVEYSAERLAELVGKKNQRPAIHYDYLYVEA